MEHSEKAGKMDETGYLCVDSYTSTLVGTRALATAFELGLIDLVLTEKEVGREYIMVRLGIDRHGLELLLGTLLASGVFEERGWEERDGGLAFTEGFSRALEYRDLMEVRAGFSNLCALDLINHFTALVKDPDLFMGSAQLFKLFDYGHALAPGQENLERTRTWVKITTTLTKYEAGVVMKHHDFSPYKRILDIGGNSGEFVLLICRGYPEMRGTVFDLPLVCEIGRQHVAGEPEAERIEFVGGDALSDELPGEYDAVTFKSVLHDWPDDAAARFIRRAARSVKPGGTLLIFERGLLDLAGQGVPYHLVPYLLFTRFFRSPALYVNELTDLGFEDVTVKTVELETPFYLVIGVKGRE
jgi:SAM-dependent methyltransferase